jgi:hypothetical protein
VSFGAIIGFCLLFCNLWLSLVDYVDFRGTILHLSGKQGWEHYFETQIISTAGYTKLRWFLFALLLSWVLLAVYLKRQLHSISGIVRTFAFFIKHRLRKERQFYSTKERVCCLLLALLFLVKGCYFIQYYELQYDEAWTYNHFVSKGFWMCLLSPNNNHILYTLFACLTDYLPIAGKYSLRLPVLLGGISTGFIFYVFMRSLFGWRPALTALVFLLFLPAVTQYSMYARGYIFQIFCTVVVLWASQKIILATTDLKNYWILWVLSNALGVYAVPSHLILLLMSSLFILGYIISDQSRPYKQYLLAHFFLMATLCLLFLPYLLTAGYQPLFESATQVGGDSFWAYQDKVSDWLLWGGGRGTPVFVFWCFLLILLVYLRQQLSCSPAQKLVLSMSFALMLLPTLVDVLLGIQPLFRIWCFLTPAVAILLAALIKQLNSKFESSYLFLFIAVPIALILQLRMDVHYALNWSKQLYKNAQMLAQVMLQNKIEDCYSFSNYDKPLLEYYYLRADQPLRIRMPYKNSHYYAPFVETNYSSVLWDKEDGRPTAAQIRWFKEHYPVKLYEDDRIELRLPSVKEGNPTDS